MIQKYKERIKKRRIKFLNNAWVQGLIKEEQEYIASFEILKKYSKTKKITKEEVEIIHEQLWDTLKITGLGIVFIVPGGALLLTGLIILSKKTGWNILPSAFRLKK